MLRWSAIDRSCQVWSSLGGTARTKSEEVVGGSGCPKLGMADGGARQKYL